MTEERALTLQEAAERLHLSYSTIFAKRAEIGFRLPGSRVWRVWPSKLAALTEKRSNVTRLSLRVGGVNECPSVSTPIPAPGGSISARQAANELDVLLGRKTERPPRNTTTR